MLRASEAESSRETLLGSMRGASLRAGAAGAGWATTLAGSAVGLTMEREELTARLSPLGAASRAGT